jgi:hypothetical protein
MPTLGLLRQSAFAERHPEREDDVREANRRRARARDGYRGQAGYGEHFVVRFQTKTMQPADPTFGGLIPPDYQPGPYLERLRAIAASGRVLPDHLKILEQKISAIQSATIEQTSSATEQGSWGRILGSLT